jgi:hypothetical protein
MENSGAEIYPRFTSLVLIFSLASYGSCIWLFFLLPREYDGYFVQMHTGAYIFRLPSD